MSECKTVAFSVMLQKKKDSFGFYTGKKISLPLGMEGKFLIFLIILNRNIQNYVKMCDDLHLHCKILV